MTLPKRSLRFALLAPILAILALLGTGAWFLFDYSKRGQLPFDSETWQSAQSRSNDIRVRMVDDLLRRYSFQGMTRNQVTAIIGEPDKTEYFRNCDLVYWLGPERGFISIDSEWLVFRLDGDKKVAECRVLSD